MANDTQPRAIEKNMHACLLLFISWIILHASTSTGRLNNTLVAVITHTCSAHQLYRFQAQPKQLS
jgi:hypothetical protein